MSEAHKRTGAPWMVGKSGEKSARWKGNNITYTSLHTYIRYRWKRATHCENPDCIYPRKNAAGITLRKPKRFEYALIHGKKYTKDRENYIMLCPSCHRKYDSGLIRILLTNRYL